MTLLLQHNSVKNTLLSCMGTHQLLLSVQIHAISYKIVTFSLGQMNNFLVSRDLRIFLFLRIRNCRPHSQFLQYLSNRNDLLESIISITIRRLIPLQIFNHSRLFRRVPILSTRIFLIWYAKIRNVFSSTRPSDAYGLFLIHLCRLEVLFYTSAYNVCFFSVFSSTNCLMNDALGFILLRLI